MDFDKDIDKAESMVDKVFECDPAHATAACSSEQYPFGANTPNLPTHFKHALASSFMRNEMGIKCDI
jgi:hypothetical protein